MILLPNEANRYRIFYESRADVKFPTSDNPELDAVLKRIQDWCAITNGQRVLDFGCYDGYILRKLRQRRRIRGVGVDVSMTALKLARLAAEHTALSFSLSDGAALPFSSGAFDVVICSEVLEHVQDMKRVLEEISRVT